MLPNAKLRKKIVSQDGEVVGHSASFYPIAVKSYANAKKESTTVVEGLKSGRFSSVVIAESTFTNNYADLIENGDMLEFSGQKRIASYVELSQKNMGQFYKIYYIGLE